MRKLILKTWSAAFLFACLLFFPTLTLADEILESTVEQLTHTLFERIAGRPIFKDDPRFRPMYALVANGRFAEAARVATADPGFSSITMRLMVTPWSTREREVITELNDFTVILMKAAEKEIDFRRTLIDDTFYSINLELTQYMKQGNNVNLGLDGRFDPTRLDAEGKNTLDPRLNFLSGTRPEVLRVMFRGDVPMFIPVSNGTSDGVDLNQPRYPKGWVVRSNTGVDYLKQNFDVSGFVTIRQGNVLKRVEHMVAITSAEIIDMGSRFPPAPHAIAGVLSSRAWAAAHLNMGTNRRAVSAAFSEFLCTEMNDMRDTSMSTEWIRRDVDRKPGGEALAFQTDCRGCHAGLDPLTQAFGKYTYEGTRVSYDNNMYGKVVSGSVAANASTYPAGYVPANESWVNLFTQKQNAKFGWRGATSGFGLKQFGEMLANSRAFSACMAKKVFKEVCQREVSAAEMADIEALANIFEGSNYNMKRLFEHAAVLGRCFSAPGM